MKALARRVRRLESRAGTTAPVPWELPGWEQWSEAEQMQAYEQYMAVYPQSWVARMQRKLEALSDCELEELLVEAEDLLRGGG